MTAYLIAYSYYPQYEKKFFSLVNSLALSCEVGKIIYVVFGGAGRGEVFRSLGRDSVVLAHDNEGWEFGAYQRGLDVISKELEQGDVVIVLNDTTGVHSIFDRKMRKSFQESILRYKKSTIPVVIGEVDAVAESLEVLRMDAGQWVRSCIFALNYEAVKALDGVIYKKKIAEGISLDSSGGLIFSKQVANEALVNHVSQWIKVGKRIKAKASSVGASFLVNKSASIINEKYISAAVMRAGGVVVDVCDRRFLQHLAFRVKRKIFFMLGKS